MRTANFTDFRANLKGYMDAVIDDCDTVIINRGNDTGVVLISLEEINSVITNVYESGASKVGYLQITIFSCVFTIGISK